MTTRIEDIILRARDILADPNAERWSDDRLIRLIDEGQRDVAHFTKILKGETTIPILVGHAIYSLPEDVFLITRASFDDCQITMLTHDRMDELATVEATSSYQDAERRRGYAYSYNDRPLCWETAEGATVEHVIYDERDMSEIRIYPIPSEGLIDTRYSFTTDTPDYAGAELLGVVVDAEDYTFDQYNGVVTELFDPQIAIETSDGTAPFGVVTDMYEYSADLKIWYVRTPVAITSVDSELEIPRHFDVAIKHYIVWHAFRDDYDTRNQEKAGGAAALYERELNLVKEVESKNGARAPQRRTTYRGAFN